MKTRVLSIRVNYDTIALCYELSAIADKNPRNRPVGTVISELLEAVVEHARIEYGLSPLNEEQAEAVIHKYITGLPGIDVDPVVALREAKPKATPAVKENVRPTEPSVQRELATVLQPAEPSSNLERSCTVGLDAPELPDKFTLGEITPRNRVVDFTHRGPGKSTAVQEYEMQKDAEAHGFEPPYAEPTPSVEEVIEEEARAEEVKDTAKIFSEIEKPVERSDAEMPAPAPKCPWQDSPVLKETDQLLNDQLYKEAKEMASTDKIWLYAVHTVYAVLPEEEWSSERAVKLVKKTYENYKRWEEKYGTRESN